jgi:hypothetical protein
MPTAGAVGASQYLFYLPGDDCQSGRCNSKIELPLFADNGSGLGTTHKSEMSREATTGTRNDLNSIGSGFKAAAKLGRVIGYGTTHVYIYYFKSNSATCIIIEN